MKYIASFSGGKDSTAQIILAHENGEPLDLIIFSEVMFDSETSGELPEHIDFIKNKCIPLFKKWGYETKILHSDKTYMDMFLHEPIRGKRFGTGLMTGFPMAMRCHVNRDLKVKPITKFIKSYGDDIIQYVGIAKDEPKRLKKLENTNRTSLLVKYGYTEQMAYDLCEKYGLLSPTYSFSKRGGCWFCPNATKSELRYLRRNHKDLWNRLLELENTPNLIGNIWNTLTKTSIHDMEAGFLAEDIQMATGLINVSEKMIEKELKSKETVEKIPKDDITVIVATKQSITKHLKELDKIFDAFRKNYFFSIGFGLYWFDDTGAYQQIGTQTYDNIAEFAKDRYGISKATTYQYLAVIKKFGKINPETGEIDAIQDEYKDYKSTALIIMSGMTDEQLKKCSPDMKTKELKAIRDGIPLIEDKQENDSPNGEKTQSQKPKPSAPGVKANMQPLFKIESVTDFEKRSKEIMEAIKKVLSQNNGTNYNIDISMTWD